MPHAGVVRRLIATGAAVAFGTVATVAMTPRAATSGPVRSGPVQLLSSPLQPVIDQLLDAQRQITDTNSNFPFITGSDLPMLPEYEQMLASTMLGSVLNMLARNQFCAVVVPWAPYPWSVNAADPQPFLTYNNPDNFYSSLPVDPGKTYLITVHTGPGTQDVTFLANAGDGVTVDFHPLAPALDLANATPNPDGTYTMMLSATQPAGTPAGNWVDTAGANTVVIRDTLGDWGRIHDSFAIEQVGGTGALTLPLLSQDQISTALSTVGANMYTENLAGSYLGQFEGVDTVPINTFSSIAPTTEHIPGPLMSNQLTSLGNFLLQPGQALIVKVPDIDSAYSSIMLANAWGQTNPFVTALGSLNNTQTYHDPDGFTYYVISSQDPGVANWVDNSGIEHGGVWLRWQNITGPVPSSPVQTEIVNVADVHNEIGNLLPADTPLVTAAERAAELHTRMFEYGYAHDQSHNIAWVGGNLMYDQIKAAMGADQFQQIFGGQTDVPSIWDRLAPALTPNMFAVAAHLLAHPGAGLTAFVNNVPLAVKDIELPIILAGTRMLAVAAGGQDPGAVFNQTLTDPATSITAGFLNARDDLAVAILNANSSTTLSEGAPLWDALSQLNHAVLQLLSHSPAPAADIGAPGVDLDPAAAELPLDVSA